MKKRLLTVFLFLLSASASIQSQTLDEILHKFYAANAQDTLLKITTMKVTGKMIQGSLEIPYTQTISRPSSFRFELTFQGITMIQTFNGKEGWTLSPFSGSTTAQPYSDDDIKTTRYSADIDGMLWNPAEKGYTLTYDGQDDMEGTLCFILKIVTRDGDIFKYYIDSDSYIPLRLYSKVKVLGNQSESDTYYSNYKMIRGIPVALKIESKSNGVTAGTNIIDKVEFDTPLSPGMFDKPETRK
ncbi:MAG TPA: hypothetical protein VMT63_04610 [Bacteroidales bacterium]|nr:hypothetical protein [Bacteroidales bacterium]